jgi:hypothetical protein
LGTGRFNVVQVVKGHYGQTSTCILDISVAKNSAIIQDLGAHKSYNSLSEGSNEVTMLGSERMASEEVCTVARGVPKPDFLGPNGPREGGVGLPEIRLADERTVPVGDCTEYVKERWPNELTKRSICAQMANSVLSPDLLVYLKPTKILWSDVHFASVVVLVGTNVRGIGFPLIGVRGGDSRTGEPPNGLPPGIRGEVFWSDMVDSVTTRASDTVTV